MGMRIYNVNLILCVFLLLSCNSLSEDPDTTIFEGQFEYSESVNGLRTLNDSLKEHMAFAFEIANDDLMEEFVRLYSQGKFLSANEVVSGDSVLSAISPEGIFVWYNLKMVYEAGYVFHPCLTYKGRKGENKSGQYENHSFYLSEEKYESIADSIEKGMDIRLEAREIGKRDLTGFKAYYVVE